MAIAYVLWHYKPSLVAAIAMASIFGVATAVHSFRLVQTRAFFCIPLVIGGIFEACGYGARAWAHSNTTKTMPYAIQSLLILLGPILFAASIYMVLGRLIRSCNGKRYSLISTKWMTKIFVGGDVTCFLIQGGGGGILSGAKSQKTVKLGERVILGGLIFQIIVFAVFVAVAASFHLRAQHILSLATTHYLFLLYMVSTLITLRNVYRVIEYAWGSDGYLLNHEWTLYVCDAMSMAGVLIACLAWYSCNFNDRRERLHTSDGVPLDEEANKGARRHR